MSDTVEYSQEWVDAFCAEIADGKSLRSVCLQPGMPSKRTIFNWLGKYPEFREKYRIATEERAESYAEEIIEIADDGSNDWIANNDPDNPGYKFNGEHFGRSRLRVDTRKWICAKMKPKKYGEKVEHTIMQRPASELTEVELERIAAGGSAGTAESPQSPAEPSSVH